LAILRSGKDPAYVMNEKLKRCQDFKNGYYTKDIPYSYKGKYIVITLNRQFSKRGVSFGACVIIQKTVSIALWWKEGIIPLP